MKLLGLLLIALIVADGRATATTVDEGIRRGAAVFVCEQLRAAGLSNSKVVERTYRFHIVRHDDEAMLGVYNDLYEFGSTRGIMNFTMARIYDGRWGVYEYGFTPDSNDSEFAEGIRSRFISTPTGSFTTSRRACSDYLAETSLLKKRIEDAAIRSVEHVMQFGHAVNKCRHEGTARPGVISLPARQAGGGCVTKPKPADVKERVCAFNEAYRNVHVIVEVKHKTHVYDVAIRQEPKDFSEQFIDYDDRVVQELEPPASEGVLEHC